MICPACGATNREGAHFCKNCGFDLVAAAAGEQPPTPAAGSEPEQPAAEEEAPEPLPGEPEKEDQVEGPVAAEPQPEQEPAQEPAPGPTVGEVTDLEAAPPEPDDQEPRPEEEDQPTEPPAATPDEELPEADDEDLLFWRDEAEPLAALEAGHLVAGRYQLVEALDVQAEEVLYLAEDLHRCWQCGFEGNQAHDTFCSQCGAALEPRPEVRLLQVASPAPDKEPEAGTGFEVASRLEEEGRTFFVLAEVQDKPAEPAEPVVHDVRFIIGQCSDPGKVRALNEDSVLTMTLAPTYESRTTPALGTFAVADGMGGHEGGEVASKLALQVLAEQVLRTILLPELTGELALDEDLLVRLRQAILAANDTVFLARQKRSNDMGTTLTVVLVRNTRLLVGHVGDCRAFRWNAGGLEQLTTDHSVVASMIANGQAAPDEIYTHPHRSVIYRSIGDKPSVEVDTEILPLVPGDRIVVCSDGLWEMVRNEGITDVLMQEADPQTACEQLVRHANVAGGEDNISVVVVQVVGM